jgi:dipeptidyl aminopeptidase/acylaminoacyl peptidase
MRQLLLIGLVWVSVAVRASAAPHPFNVQDLLAMQRISDPRPSPGGDRVAFVLRTTDFAANKGQTDVWAVGIDGHGLVQLTHDKAADNSPRWSPDGKSLYFLSTRSGSAQVWRLAAGGAAPGQPVQITALPVDVGSFAVSPDGNSLVVSGRVLVDCPDLACTQTRTAAKAKEKASGLVYDQLFVRHWDTWNDGQRSHLFLVSAAPKAPVSAARDLTRGMDADVPSLPFGGSEEYTFSPDGQSLVFAARVAGREEAWSTNFDLYQVAVDGTAPPRNLTADNPAWDTQPVFSPDGKTLAYLAMSRPGFEADRFRIVLRPVNTGDSAGVGPARVLAESWDRSPNEILFSADGKTIYASALQVGQQPLFAFDVASGDVRELVAKGSVHSPALAQDKLVFGLDHLPAPTELHTVRADGSGLQAITTINRERVAAAQLGAAEPFDFKGANGDTVHGFLVKPVGFDPAKNPAKKVPVALLIHGGPQGSFHNEFHYRWNPQIYAGAGYAAVMIDFHGSTGYGQAFTDAIAKDWGGKPLEDLEKGLAAVLERNPWMDDDRVCALGASYGGYMINWIAGRAPDRFRCLVNHDGIFDQRLMYYSTEELWFPEWEQGGPYYSHPELHERDNPAQHVDRWKTPMLVVQGGLDYRVPDTQGLATFNALQRRGVPSRLLYFPDENHWVLKPANSILWHDTVLAWLEKWLRP